MKEGEVTPLRRPIFPKIDKIQQLFSLQFKKNYKMNEKLVVDA